MALKSTKKVGLSNEEFRQDKRFSQVIIKENVKLSGNYNWPN